MHALVTGASRGIGLALVEALTAQGHAVTGTCRGAVPSRAGWISLDVTDPASVRDAARHWGEAPLDLLVCNAGVLPDRAETLDTGYPAAMWADALAVNVTGVFLCVQAFLPALRRAASAAAPARIAIISSRMGSSDRATGGTLIYRASKAAAVNLGRNLAADLRRDGIAVGIYHPGWVQTDMGGGAADLPPARSARDLVARFAALSLATTGSFQSHDGKPIPC